MESNYFEYFVPKSEILGVLSNHFSIYRMSNINSGIKLPFLNGMEYKFHFHLKKLHFSENPSNETKFE